MFILFRALIHVQRLSRFMISQKRKLDSVLSSNQKKVTLPVKSPAAKLRTLNPIRKKEASVKCISLQLSDLECVRQLGNI